jgi:hypothetical protein
LVPRLFWQGGVAYDGSTLVVSYAGRNYAGVELPSYLVHETTHALAGGFVARGSDVGGLIGEGVAVYAAGGHYGPEPLDDWAAILARSERYVPLCRLRATFPQQQHEIAYLEGASFIDYLIRTYGLAAFRDFYAHDPGVPDDAAKKVDAFCAREATRRVVGIGKTYAELEAGWRRALDARKPNADEAARLWGQIRFYDLMRRYQERRDPPARILPPPPPRWNGDLRRQFAAPASAETNVVQEALFFAADQALNREQPAKANAIMDELQSSISTNVFTGTTGRDYAAITDLLEQYARAQRVGDMPALAATALGGAVPFEEQLWADYRLVLNRLDVDGNAAIADVERSAQPLDAPAERSRLRVTLLRTPAGWRIASIESDPSRPPNLGPLPRELQKPAERVRACRHYARHAAGLGSDDEW